ncbi:hypothetical protein BaRGS_00026747 [Batillaria attramentaria]|uniref:Uncharacterized protein n=1 Tax=Batillaria attramentaria TaxID=370345 RepID=A0ABD0K561_9CAEN
MAASNLRSDPFSRDDRRSQHYHSADRALGIHTRGRSSFEVPGRYVYWTSIGKSFRSAISLIYYGGLAFGAAIGSITELASAGLTAPTFRKGRGTGNYKYVPPTDTPAQEC